MTLHWSTSNCLGEGHHSLGDMITLPRGWKVPIVGVYSDYGNPTGQAIVAIDALTHHYPNVSRLRFGVRIDPQGFRTEAGGRGRLRTTPQNVVDQANLKRRSLEVFEQTFSVTAALNVLTLVVAGVALFASMTTLSGMRLPQLAPVWAMGLTRRRLAELEFWRTMLLVLVTLVLAIPVGIALAWVLLAVVNVEAFGWRLPLQLFFRQTGLNLVGSQFWRRLFPSSFHYGGFRRSRPPRF